MPGFSRRAMLAGLTASALGGCGGGASAGYFAQVERAFPPLGFFIDMPGGRLHYVREGSGPPVVLIHGASGNLRDFTFSFSERVAAAGFTAISVDRPGFGYSDRAIAGSTPEDPASQARVIARGLRGLGIERPVVVGHSYGGAVASAWMLGDPDSLSGAVSLAGITHPWSGGDNYYHALASTELLGPTIRAAVQRRAESGSARGAVDWVFRPQLPPPGYAGYLGVELAARPETFTANARDIAGVNAAMERLSPRFATTRVPFAIVHGDADRIVPIEDHAARVAALRPDADITRLPGIGHMVHHVAADEALAAIRRVAA